MRTRFQVDIESCAASFFSGLFDGKDFCMLQAVVRVAASADDCPLRVHKNSSDAWIGRGQSDTLPSQIEGSAEEEFVSIA
jgi:hypothetical protein